MTSFIARKTDISKTTLAPYLRIACHTYHIFARSDALFAYPAYLMTYIRLTYHIFAHCDAVLAYPVDLMARQRMSWHRWSVSHISVSHIIYSRAFWCPICVSCISHGTSHIPTPLHNTRFFGHPIFIFHVKRISYSHILMPYSRMLHISWHNDVTYVHTLHTMRHSSDTFCTYLRLTCPTFAHSDAVYAYAAYLMSRPIDVTSHWCHVPLMSRPISPRPTRWCVISWIAQMNVSIASILGFRV